ncbi:MAG: flagellar hook protein FliD [Betaproteobacteria bacterium]|nr:flagellar hook protein FliD [Betaproteobacteria bacterium]
MTAAITTGTNIDVNTLVTQLMQVESQPLTVMQTTQQSYKTKITAYGQLQSALSGLSSSMSALQNTSTFQQNTTSVSDTSVLTATATSSAAAGTHTIEVQKLAAAQQLASGRFASTDTTVGTGTLTFEFGSNNSGVFTTNAAKNSFSINIDASNNTLAGVRDAINNANGGVRATIINDGAGYRLALAPADSGTSNSLRITTADGDGNATDASGLSQLAYDPAAAAGAGKNLTQNIAAQDATAVIDGITVTKPTNNISDAIPGLTLNLAKVALGAPVSVTVATNTAAITTALNSFVSAYNAFSSKAHTLTFYDASAKTAGDLQGDATANSVISQVRAVLTSSMSGLNGGLSSLSQVGIGLQADGTLALDSSKLNAALANPAFNVASLFATTGNSSDARVSYQSSASSTPPGSYAIAITQPATRGNLTASSAAPLTITAGVNDALNLTVNGQATSVTLSAGTYASADALSAEIQSKLNGSPALLQNGVSVNVSQSGGLLSIMSFNYGASSIVTGLGGSGAGLFGSSPVETDGANVAGTVNGVAATGNGQTLVSAEGLRVRISATAAGSLGTMTLNNGYAAQLASLIDSLTDTNTGAIASRTTGLTNSVNRLTDEETTFNERLTSIEANYRKQFSTLDAALSAMKTTSSFLTQQLAGLTTTSA